MKFQPIHRVLLLVALFSVIVFCACYITFSNDFIKVFTPGSVERLKQDAKAQLCLMLTVCSIVGVCLLITKSDKR